MKLIVATLLLAGSLSAQSVAVCEEYRKGHQIPPPCIPPQFLVKPNAPVPFNAPVRFGWEVRVGGQLNFVWIKAGEPPRPCTPAEVKQGPAYKQACAAKVGDPLYQFRRVRKVE